jgi:hypothetical protein
VYTPRSGQGFQQALPHAKCVARDKAVGWVLSTVDMKVPPRSGNAERVHRTSNDNAAAVLTSYSLYVVVFVTASQRHEHVNPLLHNDAADTKRFQAYRA